MKPVSILLVSALFAVPACGKSSKAAKAGGASSSTLTLPKLGLKMEAPAGATAGDEIGGSGQTVTGTDLVVNVELAASDAPKTIDDAKSDADMYSPKNVATQKLPDGWALTFENTGSAGTNYWVQVRRAIGGKDYMCETTAGTPAQSQNALAACKSLKI